MGDKGVMQDGFQEHAANERTYLAWVRTAVAIAGFGVVIERLPTTPDATWTGLALVGLSALLVVAATARFLAVRRLIARGDAPGRTLGATEGLFAVTLALLLVSVMAFLASLAVLG